MSGRPVVGVGARLTKIRAMSLREVVHRLRYRCVVEGERLQHRTGRIGRGTLERALVRPLQGEGWRRRLLDARAGCAARFLAGTHDREAMRRLFQGEYRGELADTLAHACDAREHRFEFFGRRFIAGRDIDWQADPVSGRRWPARFHADVPIHGGDAGFGDVKYVWELSRQQYLIDLGKAAFLTGSAADVQAVQRLVRGWIAGNPYATGVNWACALEPAFRIFSWLWAYHLTAGAIEDDFHIEWLAAIHDHGRFIARHLEHHSSPYNHLIGEAAALYMIGAAFPEFEAAPTWRAAAREVLVERLEGQFYADGGSVEQSTFYHHATVGYYLLAALMARATGDEFPAAVWGAIERGIAFSASLVQPDGKTPEIGGADDGKPIRMEHLPFWDFRPYQAIGAVLFSRGDFKAVAGRFFEDALWLLGPAGRDRFLAIAPAPGPAPAALPASGYWVLRGGRPGRAHYVCFDCGEQAAGMRTDAVPNSMHGHADCLSIVAWLGGRRVLVDSGFYAYNCGGAWEAHFRETAAHNTARVDGRDQARHIGKMAWSHSYRAAAEGAQIEAPGGWVVGSHDGYARRPDGVTHRRAVWLRPDGCLVVYDEFVGQGTHDLEVNYQFAPGALEVAGEARARYERDIELAWTGTGAWQAAVRAGGAAPGEGWISPSLGVKVAAPRLTLSLRSADPRTVLLMVVAAPPAVVFHLPRAERACGLVPIGVASSAGTDWIVAGAAGGRDPIATDALVGISRVRDGIELEASWINGSYLRADAPALSALEPAGARAAGVVVR